ncbi:hypothetical protein TanjilG_08603 [Lupinus angustifolius]|uniref:Uncharacterized protein n=1 Tax=Lupinus angustifolius TaxID=3871 RepID=A0A4P1RPZ9_LUPAN|nr:hypothetical protein TanjilG_08603 [Lupinus angustifolius]
MDAKKKEQEQYTSITFFSPNPNTLYPMFSAMEFNLKENARANKSYYNSFAPCEASCGYFDGPFGKHVFEKSETDSCSERGSGDDESDEECDDECEDEEVTLDELLHEGKTKNKIEMLAAMVGVDTTEPEIVLAEVVRVLKHLKRINQLYLSA